MTPFMIIKKLKSVIFPRKDKKNLLKQLQSWLITKHLCCLISSIVIQVTTLKGINQRCHLCPHFLAIAMDPFAGNICIYLSFTFLIKMEVWSHKSHDFFWSYGCNIYNKITVIIYDIQEGNAFVVYIMLICSIYVLYTIIDVLSVLHLWNRLVKYL